MAITQLVKHGPRFTHWRGLLFLQIFTEQTAIPSLHLSATRKVYWQQTAVMGTNLLRVHRFFQVNSK